MRVSDSVGLGNEIGSMGFKKQNFATNSGLEYRMFGKDILHVIQKQISDTDDCIPTLDLLEHAPRWHPMNGYNGKKTCDDASQYIKSSL